MAVWLSGCLAVWLAGGVPLNGDMCSHLSRPPGALGSNCRKCGLSFQAGGAGGAAGGQEEQQEYQEEEEEEDEEEEDEEEEEEKEQEEEEGRKEGRKGKTWGQEHVLIKTQGGNAISF